MVSAGLGFAGLGVAGGVQAQVGPFPQYHWCPGQPFDPSWGPNWDWNTCHDDHHRDVDGPNHSNDYWGPGPDQHPGPGEYPGGPGGPGPEQRPDDQFPWSGQVGS